MYFNLDKVAYYVQNFIKIGPVVLQISPNKHRDTRFIRQVHKNIICDQNVKNIEDYFIVKKKKTGFNYNN